MKAIRRPWLARIVACGAEVLAANAAHAQALALMPQPADYTSMWWAEGFPGVADGAPWQRVIQTGHYAMVLDTETLQIPHLGAVPAGTSYTDCGSEAPAVWRALPPADLGLTVEVNGQRYRCTGAGEWSRFKGPRLIESGRFLQRADVTDLVFASDAGERLNVEARFETVAWPDRLGLVLAAAPGRQPIRAGDAAFGHAGGGFGLDGSNDFSIPHAPGLDPERFTLEFWAFVPPDYRASQRAWPWLVCKNRNELADGNFGILLIDGKAQARINIGGGRAGATTIGGSRPVKIDAWNHFALSYDGETFRFFLNGAADGEQRIARKRNPGSHPLVFGRREDNSGDGYHFRGIVDEIRLYDRSMLPAEWRQPPAPPVGAWCFREDGQASASRLMEPWQNPTLEIALASGSKRLARRESGSEVALPIDPRTFEAAAMTPPAIVVDAGKQAIDYDPGRGWFRIALDGIEPLVPGGDPGRRNDAIERIKFTLSNPGGDEQVARLLFEKTAHGIRQAIGSPITGISAILRDADGQPTGIPVQLSKNWHNHPEAGTYAGQWFHGISQVRLPAGARVELELTIAYGHWGGVAAASHAQLSLIGWGTNQRWDESALGSWGESICYEPDQIQGKCSILDVRPVMVRPMNGNGQWSWTNNVGGGDYFRLSDPAGNRLPHQAMRASYLRYGPCLTEVTYSGRIGAAIRHRASASLARTDDVVRGTYRLRMFVDRPLDFSRFALFQVGADAYNQTRDASIATGNSSGLVKEWAPRPGGDGYRTQPLECRGEMPWISLVGTAPPRKGEQPGAWANRGIVIRSWDAQLGGKPASPWIAEHGSSRPGGDTSTLDLVPPPGVTRLEAGDFLEATIEYIVMPQSADDYYGPNAELRAALTRDGNSWKMIHREAGGNARQLELDTGTLQRSYPDICIMTHAGSAALAMAGGLGYIPITFTGLDSPDGFTLVVDGQPLDQSIHGNDYWQTDFDPASARWSRTYNLALPPDRQHTLHFAKQPPSQTP